MALQNRLDYLSITDHDSVEGIADALRAARGSALTLIPGVELSSVDDDGRDIHVLGYFIDHHDGDLLEHLTTLRASRLQRAHDMVRTLAHDGINVPIDEVLAYADGGSVGRSHVARALVARGHATSIADAFERFIGRNGPHYVAKQAGTPAAAIGVIRRAGGVAVVAHPGINGLSDAIPSLAATGLAGVEAYHADHSPEDRSRYAHLADTLGLACTGGSDFHGPDAPNPALGSVDLPPDALRRFLALRS